MSGRGLRAASAARLARRAFAARKSAAPAQLKLDAAPGDPRRYGASYWRLFRANFLRSWRLQLRSKLFM